METDETTMTPEATTESFTLPEATASTTKELLTQPTIHSEDATNAGNKLPENTLLESHGKMLDNYAQKLDRIYELSHELNMTLGDSKRVQDVVDNAKKIDKAEKKIDRDDPFAHGASLAPADDRPPAEWIAGNTFAAKNNNYEFSANDVTRRLKQEIYRLNERFGLSEGHADPKMQAAIDELLSKPKTKPSDSKLEPEMRAKAQAYLGELEAAYTKAGSKQDVIAGKMEAEIKKYSEKKPEATPSEAAPNNGASIRFDSRNQMDDIAVPSTIRLATQFTPSPGTGRA